MPKSLLSAALVAVAAILLPAAQAQAPAPAGKKELAARIVTLQQPAIEALARGLAEQPALQLMQQAGAALQRVPTERRDALARDIEADLRKYAEEVTPIVSGRAVKLAATIVAPMLEERFAEDELRQLVNMLESPVLRKYQGMAPEFQRALVEKLVGETKSEVEPRVQRLQQTLARRLGMPAAPASAASAARK